MAMQKGTVRWFNPTEGMGSSIRPSETRWR